ncbi:tryptophan synthase subunit alpha [candidate division KSB1 bacterium]|nr:tryptophan synthase subunit alpha [candidate division KSB1 bacterium]
MNRLNTHFNNLKNKNEKALILYITAGDPNINTTFEIMKALAENGADCIELGIPFSDPMADGPVIQRASTRALKNDVNVDLIFSIVKRFREHFQTPMVLMGYFNTILRYGMEAFVDTFKKAGGDGLIIADLPYEEGEDFENICKTRDVSLIYLISPEMGSERTRNILSVTDGFVYCISHYGTTGGESKTENLDGIIDSIKSMTDLPVAVGFGISTLQQARNAGRIADGIIIGSWLIKELEKTNDKPKVASQFTKTLKQAIS